MVVPTALRGYRVLALLVIAQLCAAVHAAEHGVGEHTHESVDCPHGMTNDDDVIVAPPLVSPKPVTAARAVCYVPAIGVLATGRDLLPPATGPPLSS